MGQKTPDFKYSPTDTCVHTMHMPGSRTGLLGFLPFFLSRWFWTATSLPLPLGGAALLASLSPTPANHWPSGGSVLKSQVRAVILCQIVLHHTGKLAPTCVFEFLTNSCFLSPIQSPRPPLLTHLKVSSDQPCVFSSSQSASPPLFPSASLSSAELGTIWTQNCLPSLLDSGTQPGHWCIFAPHRKEDKAIQSQWTLLTFNSQSNQTNIVFLVHRPSHFPGEQSLAHSVISANLALCK